MFLSASSRCVTFESKDIRKGFLQESQIVGLYNDATICYVPSNDEFWSVLSDKRFSVTRSEVREMGLKTTDCKRS